MPTERWNQVSNRSRPRRLPRHRRQSLLIALVIVLGGVLAVPVTNADPTKPTRTAHLTIRKPGQPMVEGDVVWYDQVGFQVRDVGGIEHHYDWLRWNPKFTFDLYGGFIEHGTGAQWLELAKILQQFPTGKPQADLAFDRAVLLDPSLKAQVDAARLAMPADAGATTPSMPAVPASPPPAPPVRPAAPASPAMPLVQPPAAVAAPALPAVPDPEIEENRLLGRLAAAQGLPWPPGAALPSVAHSAPAAPGAPTTSVVPGMPGAAATPDAPDVVAVPGSPASINGGRRPTWPTLTDAQQLEAVKRLKAFAEGTTRFKADALKLHETQYFLFYSDLTPDEAERWSGLLDKMYARLAELFAVPKGQNLWYGKAVIFVFSKPGGYLAYEREAEGVDAASTTGMCNSFSNGAVHIAFYRQRSDLDFAHVLVHESVHGFVHRYRSPAHVPSWANEGLAETIASELVPQPVRVRNVQADARQSMSQRGMGEEFFTARHIAGWQYPIAESLCTYMVGQNKSGYVKFIDAVKDGMDAQEAIDKAYGAPESRLVSFFFDAMKVKEPQ